MAHDDVVQFGLNGSPNGPPLPPPAPRPRHRVLGLILTWLAITGLVTASVLLRASHGDAKTSDDSQMQMRLLQFQARYFVGAQDLLRKQEQSLIESAKSLRHGGVAQRLRFVVLAGELAGPDEAIRELSFLDDDLRQARRQASPQERRARDILGRLYHDYAALNFAAPSLNADDRAFLQKNLDWFGELALAPPGIDVNTNDRAALAGAALALASEPMSIGDNQAREAMLLSARYTATFLGAVVILLLLLMLAGLVGLIVLLVLAGNGQVRMRLRTDTGHGPVYGEAFAMFFLIFAAVPLIPWPTLPIVRSGIAGFASLFIALAWPVFRGVPWKQVREDIGLTWGSGFFTELAAGIAGYVMTLPLAAAGMIVTLVLMMVRANLAGQPDAFAPAEYPSHPIVENFVRGGPFDQAAIVLLAAVIAPFVEEIVFRGLLYQHVREASRRLWRFVSVLLSAGLVSFIFAVVHPQGLIAVPALMGLAFGFALVREWRGSLFPCMVAHGLNNGLITAVLFLVMTD